MSNVEERLNRLLILCCFTCVCVEGSNEDSSASCKVEIKVQRGSTWSAEAQQNVTVECPVDLCGKSVNVTWCKHDADDCERVNEKENVEITQKRDAVTDKLISYLRFRNISVEDGGQYSCELTELQSGIISHTILISVSEVPHADDRTDELQIPADTEPKLLYVFISSGFVLLIVMSTLFIFLTFDRWHRMQTCNHSKKQQSQQGCPDFPRPRHFLQLFRWDPEAFPGQPRDRVPPGRPGSSLPEQFPPATSKASELTLPSSSVLQTHRSVLKDIHSSATAETPPDIVSTGNQHDAAAAAAAAAAEDDEVQYSGFGKCTSINHSKSGTVSRRQHASTPDINTEYAAINVPSGRCFVTDTQR